MNLKEKIIFAKEKGITIKLLSICTGINEATLYAFTCNKRQLSAEKIKKLNFFLDELLSFLQHYIKE